MAMVINLAEARKRTPVTPNRKTFEHGGQRYTCCFDPNAPPGKQWVWIVDYVHKMRFVGTSSTLEAASVKARKEIHGMNKMLGRLEEDDVGS